MGPVPRLKALSSLLSTACTAYLPIPLGQPTTVNGVPGTGFKGPGVGGLVTAGGYGGIRISVEGAPWTIKTATAIDQITTGTPPTRIFITKTAKGWAHDPASGTSSTAQVGARSIAEVADEILFVMPHGVTMRA